MCFATPLPGEAGQRGGSSTAEAQQKDSRSTAEIPGTSAETRFFAGGAALVQKVVTSDPTSCVVQDADSDKSGTLTYEEVQVAIQKRSAQHPHPDARRTPDPPQNHRIHPRRAPDCWVSVGKVFTPTRRWGTIRGSFRCPWLSTPNTIDLGPNKRGWPTDSEDRLSPGPAGRPGRAARAAGGRAAGGRVGRIGGREAGRFRWLNSTFIWLVGGS